MKDSLGILICLLTVGVVGALVASSSLPLLVILVVCWAVGTVAMAFARRSKR